MRIHIFICLYAYIFYMCIYIYACLHIYLHTSICNYTYICTSTHHGYAQTHTPCTLARTRAHTNNHAPIRQPIHATTLTHTHTQTCAHVHTYVHVGCTCACVHATNIQTERQSTLAGGWFPQDIQCAEMGFGGVWRRGGDQSVKNSACADLRQAITHTHSHTHHTCAHTRSHTRTF